MSAQPPSDAISEDGEYVLGNSEMEKERLHLNYDLEIASSGLLTHSMVDVLNSTRPLRILDSAGSDGYWLRQFIAKSPKAKHEYICSDMSEDFFKDSDVEDIKFVKQDVNKPWPTQWAKSFDLVHQRLTLAGAQDVKAVVLALIDLVKPGGWIELGEADLDHHPEHGHGVNEFWRFVRGFFDKMGARTDLAKCLKPIFLQVGLEDIAEFEEKVPAGKSWEDEKMRQKSLRAWELSVKGVIAGAQCEVLQTLRL